MKKESKIKVLRVKPCEYPEVIEIENTLEALQREVGGSIQGLYPFEDMVTLICDEEGEYNGAIPNRPLFDKDGQLYDIVLGTFLVIGIEPDDEEYHSLSNELQEKYKRHFGRWIIL